MSRFIYTLMFTAFISACNDGGNQGNNQNTLGSNSTSPTTVTGTTIDPSTQAMYAEQITLANSYCVNQKKWQIISTSLLSAYSPKGNGSDLNYCGGENVYKVNGADFTLQLNDYCVNAGGKQVLLNGHITGSTDSGSNFISTIDSLNISGKGINLDITGNSRDGRADDNFVNLQVTDNSSNTGFLLDDVSIKKGEFDFGDMTFDGLIQTHFQFITHFNADNTEGLLYLYGQGDDKTIISADKGMITAVYTKDRHDTGTWLDLPCNN